MTAGGIGLLFAAGDGLAAVLLQAGLRADGFVGVLDSPTRRRPCSGPPPPSSRSGRTPDRAARGAEAASQFDATARAVTLGPGGVVRGAPGRDRVPAGERVPAGGVPGAGRRRRRSPPPGCSPTPPPPRSGGWLRWAVAARGDETRAGAGPGPRGQRAVHTDRAGRAAGRGRAAAGGAVRAVHRSTGCSRSSTPAPTPARPPGPGSRLSARQRRRRGGEPVAAAASGGGGAAEAAHASRFDGAARIRRRGPVRAAGAGSGGGAPAAAGGRRAGGAAVAGVGAAVAAAGKFAGQYAGRTMDASGIGYPHGGGPAGRARRSAAPPAARPVRRAGGRPVACPVAIRFRPPGPWSNPAATTTTPATPTPATPAPATTTRLRRPDGGVTAADGPVRRRPVGRRPGYRTTARPPSDGPPAEHDAGPASGRWVAVRGDGTERTAGGHAMSRAAPTGPASRSYRLSPPGARPAGCSGSPRCRRACACCSPPRS